MRFLIVGAGSIGGYVGGRLVEAGRDVTFLVRPSRAAQLRATGLQILSPHGDLTLAPRLVAADTLGEPYDVVVLAVKSYAFEGAVDDCAPAVGPDTMILPVLNGMRHMDGLTARFGAAALLGCACKIMTSLDAEGRVRQLAPIQDFAFGEMSGERTLRVTRLEAAFDGGGFGARWSASIAQEMWDKWIMLACVSSINALMRGTIGQVAAVTGGAAVALAILAECVAVVAAEGHAPSAAFLAAMAASLTNEASTQTTSLYRDLTIGQRIEADQIVGDLLRRGAAHGIATPLLAATAVNLDVYQRSLPGAP